MGHISDGFGSVVILCESLLPRKASLFKGGKSFSDVSVLQVSWETSQRIHWSQKVLSNKCCICVFSFALER